MRALILVCVVATLAALAPGCGDGGESAPDVNLEGLEPRERPEANPDPANNPGSTIADPEPEAEPAAPISRQIGRSVEGRAISVRIVGDISAPRAILIAGCIHGDEPAGIAITEALRTAQPPPGVSLWLVDEFNPDGCAAGTRQNANGVDLNRNSAWNWKPLESPGDTYYSGTGPLSEPESVAIATLVNDLRPAISIWYHQHAALVDRSGGDPEIESRYAELVGLPYQFFGRFPGSITSWQNAEFPDDTAFVVELAAGALTPAQVQTHADAVIELARELAND
jgi:protein MpaA